MTSTTHPGRLPENVAHFVRLLRAAGLPVGPGHTITAVRALAAIDVTARRQFFWALHGTLVSRREHRHIFESAFRLFWRDPFGADEALAALLSRSQIPVEKPPSRAPARLSPESESATRPTASPTRDAPQQISLRMAFSPTEVLRTKDFEEMTAVEVLQAREVIRSLKLDLRPVLTRRHESDPRGRFIDLRRTLRNSVRTGGCPLPLERRSMRTRRPTIVALCDISGSMESYSRGPPPLLPRPYKRRRSGPYLRLRHPSHEHHPAPSRPGRGPRARPNRQHGAGLVWRHSDRCRAPGLQPALVSPAARSGRGRAPRHRRSGPRGGRGDPLRGAQAAQVVQEPDLAQPAAALPGLRAQGRRESGLCCPRSTNIGQSTIWTVWRSWPAR